MAPIAIPATPNVHDQLTELKAKLKDQNPILPPDNALLRYQKAGIDLSNGYPYYPKKPRYVQEVEAARTNLREYVDPATRADPEKKALFGAAKSVVNLTQHLGTELVGVQLRDLSDKQRDELALLVAERSVVFLRDQDLSPQQQQELGLYLGHGEIERHPQVAQVPGLGGGVSLIWEQGRRDTILKGRSYRVPYTSGQYGGTPTLFTRVSVGMCNAHTSAYPPGYTHLHQDTVPSVGGDTLWASGYAAYDKLSPTFKKMLDGLNGVYRSAHKYKDQNDEEADGKYVTRVHPLIRTHPVTGWKALWINQAMMIGIDGLDRAESDAILKYLFDLYERSTDIQLRWHWTPGTSAIWDNRTTIHTVSYDYEGERHGTRVSSLAEKPLYDPTSKSRAEALQLKGWVDTPDVSKW